MASKSAVPPPASTSGSASASAGSGGSGGGEMATIDAVAAGAGSCIGLAVGSAISGGAIGGLFGLVSGLFRREGFKKAMSEAGASGRTFAIMSGVHSLVSASLKKIRDKDDVINHAVAGCATGIALGWGGTPVSMLQNCAGFAVFAFIFEGMNPPPQPAVAAELNLLGLSPPHAHCSSSSSEQQCELHTDDLCSVSSCSYPSSSACSGSSSISAGTAAADAPLCRSVSSRARRQAAGKVRHGYSNGSCPVVYSPQCHQQHLLTVLPLSLSLPLAARITSSAYHF
ncbi:unnamed protein product [Closterium sp. NIES-65]|nr:unnamed protein product [Closterium sp. NIES-65]